VLILPGQETRGVLLTRLGTTKFSAVFTALSLVVLYFQPESSKVKPKNAFC
jgi:hypothetical protein